ncbi:MAG TPA: hypothetical protein VIH29_11890 [Gallionella sp.]
MSDINKFDNNNYPPALTPEEYRSWMVAAFHDTMWQNALAVLALSTEEYAKQVGQVVGRTHLANVLAGVMSYIRIFERDITDGKDAAVAASNLALFRDAEKRLRSVVRYCLDNGGFPAAQNITVAPHHPIEAIQTYERDLDTLELTKAITVYKFD